MVIGCVVPHLASKAFYGRSAWPRRFLSLAARISGAKVQTLGPGPRPHTLLLANHVSWLDILVLASATGCAFVAKDRLGNRLVHWLADQNNTIYVDRSARRAVGSQVTAIQSALRSAQPIALFPEGTTGPGDRLLPFRSTLLAAVVPAPDQVGIQPVAIDYGELASEIAWHQEPGLANALRILGRRRPILATVRLLETLPRLQDRKQLAVLAQERIAAALAASSSVGHGL